LASDIYTCGAVITRVRVRTSDNGEAANRSGDGDQLADNELNGHTDSTELNKSGTSKRNAHSGKQ